MATSNSLSANADFTLNDLYNITVSGFTYIKDYALIKGKCKGVNVSVIIGDKKSFPMSDMFLLKEASGISAKFTGEKTVNSIIYNQFQLDEILF